VSIHQGIWGEGRRQKEPWISIYMYYFSMGGKPTGAFSRSVTFWVCFAGLGEGEGAPKKAKVMENASIDQKIYLAVIFEAVRRPV
jgi:hypothetical protein